ncbi:hypothetical protein EI94DRAFT_1709783 [Lactarius quietus]|nr:hypothetical protein EI94DRAFT_1709783 [Lactarius quietus]
MGVGIMGGAYAGTLGPGYLPLHSHTAPTSAQTFTDLPSLVPTQLRVNPDMAVDTDTMPNTTPNAYSSPDEPERASGPKSCTRHEPTVVPSWLHAFRTTTLRMLLSTLLANPSALDYIDSTKGLDSDMTKMMTAATNKTATTRHDTTKDTTTTAMTTKANLPDELKTGVQMVHGDHKLDNFIFHLPENRVIGTTTGNSARLVALYSQLPSYATQPYPIVEMGLACCWNLMPCNATAFTDLGNLCKQYPTHCLRPTASTNSAAVC